MQQARLVQIELRKKSLKEVNKKPFRPFDAELLGDLKDPLTLRKISTPEELLEFQGGNLRARKYFINLLGTEEMYSGLTLTGKDKESLVHAAMRRKGYGRVLPEEDAFIRMPGKTIISNPVSVSISAMLDVRQRSPEQINEEKLKKQLKIQAAKEKRAEDLSEAVANFDRVKQLKEIQDEPIQAKIAQAQANVRQAQAAAQVSAENTGRITQSTASMIQQDSFRAASVLHSSKMGYAAVGAAAIMGLAGYNTLTGRKKRIQQDLERG